MLFFFNDTATPEIYTLSLHDALPITPAASAADIEVVVKVQRPGLRPQIEADLRLLEHLALVGLDLGDRKSTRLNSSHVRISYAVFCLKKKKAMRLLTRN